MAVDPAQMTIAEAVVAIESGDLNPSTLVNACLERIEQQEPDIQAWAYNGGEQSRMAARQLDSTDSGGSLHGIPFGVKDIIDTIDMPTEHGTPIFAGNQPTRDAACVAILRQAGGVCLGKTVTTELAHLHPGKTRNPHAITHTPGGSSSGSAAAVAACMVPFALGTQTTGSVLRPAAYCGVYGFKPSYGDINRSGVFECATSFDTLGWFTRSVEDIELVRRALIGAAALPLEPVPLSQLRIGVFRGTEWLKADTHTRELIESAASHLSASVASLIDVEPPPGFDAMPRLHRIIAGWEFARAITWERTGHGDRLSKELREGRLADGLHFSYEEYAEAQATLMNLRTGMHETMQDFDLLLTASAPGEAWEGLAATGDPVFNTAWTALHMPALSMPAFRGTTGLPVGLQLVGGFRQDSKLLACAESVRVELGIDTIRGLV